MKIFVGDDDDDDDDDDVEVELTRTGAYKVRSDIQRQVDHNAIFFHVFSSCQEAGPQGAQYEVFGRNYASQVVCPLIECYFWLQSSGPQSFETHPHFSATNKVAGDLGAPPGFRPWLWPFAKYNWEF